MKLCIVTVYDSINCGSFLQAYILGKKCESLGYDVYFLERLFKYRIELRKNHLKKSLKFLIKRGIKAYSNKRKTEKCFKDCHKKLKIINKRKLSDIQYVLIGSDTLWNVDAKYFKKNYKLFFGGEFGNKKCATYAVSVANTKKDTILSLHNIKHYIDGLYKISVRDNVTKEIVEEISNKNAELVCDPTLLFSLDEYNSFIGKRKEENKYIFLYLFNDLTEEQIKTLVDFAKQEKLIIIDGILNRSWANKSVLNNPNNFLNYMYYADYIITDTFHGTVFSVNFNKHFVSVDREKNKVNEFLCQVHLQDNLSKEDDLTKILSKEIDYQNVNNILSECRKKSTKYLTDVFK